MLALLALFFVSALSHGHFNWAVCNADRQAFCGEASSRDAIASCMRSHISDLSEECRRLVEHAQKLHEAFETCKADKDALCPHADGHKEVRECIRKNWEALSTECRTALEEIHNRHHLEHEEPAQNDPAVQPAQVKPAQDHSKCPMRHCSKDLVSFCHEATSREAVRDCLKANWDSLSDECREAIEAVMKAQNQQNVNADGTQQATNEDPAVTTSDDPVIIEVHRIDQDQLDEIALGSGNLRVWLIRLWWVYPVGLVLFIQVLACVRIRQIRRIESAYH